MILVGVEIALAVAILHLSQKPLILWLFFDCIQQISQVYYANIHFVNNYGGIFKLMNLLNVHSLIPSSLSYILSNNKLAREEGNHIWYLENQNPAFKFRQNGLTANMIFNFWTILQFYIIIFALYYAWSTYKHSMTEAMKEKYRSYFR